MSARILFTVGGMAINARHRRDVEPAYRTGRDEPSMADDPLAFRYPQSYAKRYAKHRADGLGQS